MAVSKVFTKSFAIAWDRYDPWCRRVPFPLPAVSPLGGDQVETHKKLAGVRLRNQRSYRF
jgi:hypothetical protein